MMNNPLRFLAILAALAAAGCSARPSDRVARDAATVRAERSPDKLVARGLAFASVGDLTRAEQYLAAALDEGADPAVVLPKLLRVCIAAGKERAAIAYAAPFLERHPDDVHLRAVVAALRALTGDAEGAKADFEQIVARAPDEAAPHFAYARLLKDRFGDPVAADREFRAYLRVAPNGVHAEESRASLLAVVRVRGGKR